MANQKLTDEQKVKAIQYLLDESTRRNEWVESALLCKVEEIINDEVDDSPATMDKLIKEAEHEG